MESKDKEIHDLVFGMSTKTIVHGREVRIYRPIGMRQAFVYDVEKETVTTIDTHNIWAPIKRNIYEFMEDYGAHHMGTDDVKFEDAGESEVLMMIEHRSNRSFPPCAEVFDKCYKPKTGFLDLLEMVHDN